MRKLRLLDQGVWYAVRSRINNREPLFRRRNALALFALVFRQAAGRFGFRVRALRVEDDWLVFFIRPADGFELPAIMKWVKQVFAQRFNGLDGRIGHVWGDWYWSEILDGEPPEELEEDIRVRPQRDYKTGNPGFQPFSPWFTAPFPRPTVFDP
ncbi:MAG: transposase [Treponema sp.]|jgi:REP element-mobilizing transposase RayT|nr:transposase [Treponema sp.]